MDIRYFKYTKIYRGLKRGFCILSQQFYPTAIIYQSIYCLTHKIFRLKKGNLIGINDYWDGCHIHTIVLVDKDHTTVYDNQFLGDDSSAPEAKTFECPKVVTAELENVDVYGGFSYVSKDDHIILSVYNEVTKKHWSYLNKLLKIHSGNRGVLRYRPSDEQIPKAVFLCGCAEGNYYHFLVEVLPKLALIESKGLYPEYPVITDELIDEIPSFKEALQLINKSNRKIIFAKNRNSYTVNRLGYVSDVSLMPVNIKANAELQDQDIVFSYKAIQILKEIIEGKIKPFEHKKIYLARYKSKRQRLINDEQVAALCERDGFQVIFPEELTFSEQVALIRGAEYIVGCAGAAMTNMMFATPGTRVYLITSRSFNLKHWSTYMRMFGVTPILVDAEIAYQSIFASESILKVDEREIDKVLFEIRNSERAVNRDQ